VCAPWMVGWLVGCGWSKPRRQKKIKQIKKSANATPSVHI
jgi:hypothetical protein